MRKTIATFAEDRARVVDAILLLSTQWDAVATPSAGLLQPVYGHLAALVADVVLQPGLNYRTVVEPRIRRILTNWPSADTTSAAQRIVRRIGAPAVLDWANPEKPRRFRGFLKHLASFSVESVGDFKAVVQNPGFRRALSDVRGVGPKSFDYLLRLLGYPVIPVDRHMRRVLEIAGVHVKSYDHARDLLTEGCEVAGFDISFAERSLWLLLSRV